MNTISRKQSQQGAALLVCMVLLLGMTVVGIASMKETVTQQKIVNSITEDDTAFQAAEFAIRQGEQFIFDYTQVAGGKLPVGVVTYDGVTITVRDESENELAGRHSGTASGTDSDDNWWKDDDSAIWTDGAEVTSYPRVKYKNDESKQRYPSYVIEFIAAGEFNRGSVGMEDSDKRWNYRVTARGFGVNDSYYVILQTTYSVQL
jgi:type IV pilus assembly protein PilX